MFNYGDFYSMVEDKKKEIKKLILEDGGLTCYLGNKYGLSPGCKCCKSGTWLCVFVTKKCNLTCKWCPQERPDYPPENKTEKLQITSSVCNSIMGYELGFKLKSGIIKGVSYSGGEPFLAIDKIIKLSKISSRINPGIYQWVYTNGTYVTEENLKKLKDVGMNEIRFDWVASKFNSEILKKMEWVKKLSMDVTVEIPMSYMGISSDFCSVLRSGINAGLTRVNCAEYIINNFNKERCGIPDAQIYKELEYSGYSPYWSRLETYEIMLFVQEHKLQVTINDCSNDAKTVQKMTKDHNGMWIR